MIHNRFRVYHGPDDISHPTTESQARPDGVTVSLGDIFPLLANALDNDRTWLQDFENDEVTISPDLYEVLMAYRSFNGASA